jgi:hypothetical protein
MYMRMYVCLLFVNGLIQVMPKAVCMYMHHDRKPVCIALARVADSILHPKRDTSFGKGNESNNTLIAAHLILIQKYIFK